jgi:hypothetical protein
LAGQFGGGVGEGGRWGLVHQCNLGYPTL